VFPHVRRLALFPALAGCGRRRPLLPDLRDGRVVPRYRCVPPGGGRALPMLAALLLASTAFSAVALAARRSKEALPASRATTASVTTLPLPGGAAGIGFDDLIFAAGLKKVVVPAGRSGNLDLIDPESHEIITIAGFSAKERFRKGQSEGITSADEGRGLLFATDRTALKLDVVDPGSRVIVAQALLASSPDYVRFVESTGEVWVTEPDAERIEIFTLADSGPPTPVHAGFIPVPGGPESLVIDGTRGRAYTHLWKGLTLAIDTRTRATKEKWPNGCKGSRGIALDRKRGFLFAGCSEGKAVVLGLDRGGATLDSLRYGSGVDIIAYNPQLAHLYLPGASSATMAILGVSAAGRLSLLGTAKTASGAHCVVADDNHQAWVCDPAHGHLLLVYDIFSARENQ